MKRELDEKLCKKYPKIFINRFGDMKTTAMCWGFECGDGWYKIIDRLCSNLQWDTDKNNKDYVIENKTLRKIIPTLRNIIYNIPCKYNLKRKKQINPIVIIRSFLLNLIENWRKKQNYIHIESNRYPQIVASQVKEKFGGLRFYVESATPAQYAVISFVETLSKYICESCGSMEDVGCTEGWICVRCKKCSEKQKLSGWKQYKE